MLEWGVSKACQPSRRKRWWSVCVSRCAILMCLSMVVGSTTCEGDEEASEISSCDMLASGTQTSIYLIGHARRP